MTILPDSSVWVEWLRYGDDGPAAALDDHLAARELVACGPVVAELIAGTAARDQEELWTLLTSIPWAELDAFGWRETGLVGTALRRRGRSLPVTDVAIAVCAIRAGATLWTRDADFEQIAEVTPLQLYDGA